jgi:oligopeptide transport system ATP-binding protein
MRRKMQMIFQDPYASLNPRMTVGEIIGEPLVIHGMVKQKRRRSRSSKIAQAGRFEPFLHQPLPARIFRRAAPAHRRRARPGAQPSLIVCDEPISALDVSIQAQVVNLLEDLQEKFNLTYLFIAHDLSMVRHISNRVAVMYLG